MGNLGALLDFWSDYGIMGYIIKYVFILMIEVHLYCTLLF